MTMLRARPHNTHTPSLASALFLLSTMRLSQRPLRGTDVSNTYASPHLPPTSYRLSLFPSTTRFLTSFGRHLPTDKPHSRNPFMIMIAEDNATSGRSACGIRSSCQLLQGKLRRTSTILDNPTRNIKGVAGGVHESYCIYTPLFGIYHGRKFCLRFFFWWKGVGMPEVKMICDGLIGTITWATRKIPYVLRKTCGTLRMTYILAFLSLSSSPCARIWSAIQWM